MKNEENNLVHRYLELVDTLNDKLELMKAAQEMASAYPAWPGNFKQFAAKARVAAESVGAQLNAILNKLQ